MASLMICAVSACTYAIDVQGWKRKKHAGCLGPIELLERVLAVGQNGQAHVEVQIEQIGHRKVGV